MAGTRSSMDDLPVTAVQEAEARAAPWRRLGGLFGVLIVLLGLLTLLLGLFAWRLLNQEHTVYYGDIQEHFKYGSIGSERESGLPYWVWRVVPDLFPEHFEGEGWARFGFLYEDADGGARDLPIGLARRTVSSVDMVWLNCAVCHTGTTRDAPGAVRTIHLGMPANNLDLHGFIRLLLTIADDPRLAPDALLPAVEEAGADFGWIDRLLWRYYVIPAVREGLLARRALLGPLLDAQPAWGPGRVDTFNPYKLIQFGRSFHELDGAERIGAADFPSIFLQGPREGMDLHWDGNNASLKERNLSAAIGAGVTPETVDHHAIERVAAWLEDLAPPASPHSDEPHVIEAGEAIYMTQCAACHGYQGTPYRFDGELLGTVLPNAKLGADPARLDSYTDAFRRDQTTLFAGTEHQFKAFKKTDGYANQPLDALWLRAPYLHNGSVPTLADLLKPSAERPKAFLRGQDVLDPEKGGFQAPSCDPALPETDGGLCFDTSLPGNGNQGHEYGTDLTPDAKAALLAYLKTF